MSRRREEGWVRRDAMWGGAQGVDGKLRMDERGGEGEGKGDAMSWGG